MEQGAEEEINRLKETLAATSHKMEQIKEDFADRADKLQYAEQLLEKAKADFREKNCRIKALETHLDESRKEIGRLTQQLDYFNRSMKVSKRNSSHHLGVLACPRTMNTQQLRDLVQKAYVKQKMASEKSAKTPAVLDFNTQSHGLALEGTQSQVSAKPPHRE